MSRAVSAFFALFFLRALMMLFADLNMTVGMVEMPEGDRLRPSGAGTGADAWPEGEQSGD